MRVLVINPNTSAGATRRIRDAANACATDADHFKTVCPMDGPELIVSNDDAEWAKMGVLEVIDQERANFEGIVIASFGDTGAREAKALWPDLPIVGIATAAFATVKTLNCKFGIVTFGSSLVGALEVKAQQTGVGHHLIGITAATSDDVGDPGTVQTRFFDPIAEQCEDMKAKGADVIVLGGGPLAGMADRLAHSTSVPLIDGTRAAISMLRAFIRS